mmetsp:Transcript_37636/g.43000  ORF Transcript_37636/g.43000 Transcript_37636/m.43000 type:complete len:345 (-) Transcript_37636:41-1075(-)
MRVLLGSSWQANIILFGIISLHYVRMNDAFVVVVPSSSLSTTTMTHQTKTTTKRTSSSLWRASSLVLTASSEDQESSSKEDDDSPTMRNTSRLSHMALNVLSVDRTVGYWTEKTGEVLISRKNKEDGKLTSAFVALGNGKTTKNCFALELFQSKEKQEDFKVGNCLSYIGISMLLQFSNNLLGAITGDEKPAEQGPEPNGIIVKSSAAAPGDYFSRICIKSKDLVSTNAFYTGVLGMDAKAVDADMLCLRYDTPPNSEVVGFPTTLVFEKTTDDEIDMGTCFDHLVIATSLNIDEQYERINKMILDNNDNVDGSEIFLKPTDMFGKRIFGITDPNNYKIYLASE